MTKSNFQSFEFQEVTSSYGFLERLKWLNLTKSETRTGKCKQEWHCTYSDPTELIFFWVTFSGGMKRWKRSVSKYGVNLNLAFSLIFWPQYCYGVHKLCKSLSVCIDYHKNFLTSKERQPQSKTYLVSRTRKYIFETGKFFIGWLLVVLNTVRSNGNFKRTIKFGQSFALAWEVHQSLLKVLLLRTNIFKLAK